MATKKKKASKKKTTKKKVSKKKSIKKKVSKKKTTKKKTARKTKTKNKKIEIKVTQGGKVDGGPKSVWSITLKGLDGESISAGLVTAKNKTEAMKKARQVLRTI